MEIKNIADNIKKFQIALIQFLYTYPCYTWEEYFNQLWYMYNIAKIAYYISISSEVLSYATMYKYSLIVYEDLISFPCINFYLCIVFIKLLFLFYCHDSFFYCAFCYFNDMVYNHFVASLEYWINESNKYRNK